MEYKDLPFAVPVASQILHAVGLGWSINYRQTDAIAAAFLFVGSINWGLVEVFDFDLVARIFAV